MGLLAHALRPSGLTLGRPPYSSRPSPGDVVAMVLDLISSQRLLGKRALILIIQIFLLAVKLLSAPSDLE
jgi:hypothetical protein